MDQQQQLPSNIPNPSQLDIDGSFLPSAAPNPQSFSTPNPSTLPNQTNVQNAPFIQTFQGTDPGNNPFSSLQGSASFGRGTDHQNPLQTQYAISQLQYSQNQPQFQSGYSYPPSDFPTQQPPGSHFLSPPDHRNSANQYAIVHDLIDQSIGGGVGGSIENPFSRTNRQSPFITPQNTAENTGISQHPVAVPPPAPVERAQGLEQAHLEQRFARLGHEGSQALPSQVENPAAQEDIGDRPRKVLVSEAGKARSNRKARAANASNTAGGGEESSGDEDIMVDSDASVDVSLEDRLFTFFKMLKWETLRAINRTWGNLYGGKHEVQVSRAVLSVLVKVGQGMDAERVLKNNPKIHEKTLRRYFDSRLTRRISWFQSPGKESMLNSLTEREKKKFAESFADQGLGSTVTGAGQGSNRTRAERASIADPTTPTGKPDFSLNEFARLMVILRDDEGARRALEKAVAETCSRAELDVGVTRDSYWKIVETRFNDPNVNSRIDLSGRVDEVDSNARPLVHRTASELQTQFIRSRGHATSRFHYFKKNWSRSGANDSSPMAQDPREGESGSDTAEKRAGRFMMGKLETNQDGSLKADGKRVLIMFTVCRMGTSHEETSFLDLLSKLQPSTVDGYDEGIPDVDDVIQDRATPGNAGGGGSGVASAGGSGSGVVGGSGSGVAGGSGSGVASAGRSGSGVGSGGHSGSRAGSAGVASAGRSDGSAGKKRKRNSDREKLSDGLQDFNSQMKDWNNIHREKFEFKKRMYEESRSAHAQHQSAPSLSDATVGLNAMIKELNDANTQLKIAKESGDQTAIELATENVRIMRDAVGIKMKETKGVVYKNRD